LSGGLRGQQAQTAANIRGGKPRFERNPDRIKTAQGIDITGNFHEIRGRDSGNCPPALFGLPIRLSPQNVGAIDEVL
jgi:hypothetical protein